MTVCCCNMANAQSHAVDTALVQMATGRVADHVIPKVDDVADMGIVRSRYNVKYPSSWRVWKSTLTNGEAIINFFCGQTSLAGGKAQTHQTFVSTEAHKGHCKGQGRGVSGVGLFYVKSGYDILKISMFKEKIRPRPRCLHGRLFCHGKRQHNDNFYGSGSGKRTRQCCGGEVRPSFSMRL